MKRKMFLAVMFLVILCFLFSVHFVIRGQLDDMSLIWFKKVHADNFVFSRDGNRILAWNLNDVIVFSVAGKELFRFRLDERGAIFDVAISPKGDLIVLGLGIAEEESYVGNLSSLLAYDVNKGAKLWSFHENNLVLIRDIDFSVDGRYVAALLIYRDDEGIKRASIALFTRAGRFLWKLSLYEKEITPQGAIAFARNVLAVSVENRVVLLSINGSLIWEKEMSSPVKILHISENGNVVVVAEHNSLHLLDGQGHELWSKGIGTPIFYVDMDRNGNYIVVGGWKGAWLYTRNGEEAWSYYHGVDYVTPVAVSEEGYVAVIDNTKSPAKVLFISSDGLILWEQQLTGTIVGLCIDVTEDGSLVAVGGDSGFYLFKGKEYVGIAKPMVKKPLVKIIVSEKPPLIWTLNCSDSIRELQALGDDGFLVVTEGWLHLVLNNGTILWSKALGPPLKVASKANGDYIVTASLGKIVFLSGKGKELWIRSLGNVIRAVALFDSRIVAITLPKIYVLDMEGNIVSQIKVRAEESAVVKPTSEGFIYAGETWIVTESIPDRELVAIAFSHSNSTLLLINGKGDVLWRQQLNTSIMDLASTNNKVLVGLSNGTCLCLLVENGKILWRIKLDRAPLISITASRNGDYITVTSKDGIIYMLSSNGEFLWSYPSEKAGVGKEFYMQAIPSENSEYVIIAGKYLAILNSQGEVLWKMELPEAEPATEKMIATTSNFKYVAVIASKNQVQCYQMDQLLHEFETPYVWSSNTINWLIIVIICVVLIAILTLKLRGKNKSLKHV